MAKTVEDLLHDTEVAIQEYVEDSGGELEGDEIAADMAEAMAYDAPVEVAVEFFRSYLGYVPSQYARQHGIPATDFLEI